MYYVLTNSRGDVLGLYSASGKKVAAYDYDAWGNARVYKVTQDENGNNVHTLVTETTTPNHIAILNPIRYRGYYYDQDLEMYYLQSRYYDAQIGRFISSDTANALVYSPFDTTNKNPYAYCDNNPLTRVDNNGNLWLAFTIATICICVVVGIVVGASADEPFLEKSRNSSDEKNEKERSNVGLKDSKSKKSNNNVSRQLSTKDRATNIFIGATVGLAVGGAFVMLVAMPVTFFTVTKGARMFAIGALAFNAEAMIFAPFYSLELEPIEYKKLPYT